MKILIAVSILLIICLAACAAIWKQNSRNKEAQEIRASLERDIGAHLFVNKSTYEDVKRFLKEHPELVTSGELNKKFPEDRRPGTYFVMAAVDKVFKSHLGTIASDIGIEFYFDNRQIFIGSKVERRASGP